MSEKNTGGSAFPVLSPLGPDGTSAVGYPYVSEGMPLRDYFAEIALREIMKVNLELDAEMDDFNSLLRGCTNEAYMWADAMLKAREQ